MSIIKKNNLNIYSPISRSASLIFAWYSAERAKTGSSFSYLRLLSLSGSINPGGAAHAIPPGGCVCRIGNKCTHQAVALQIVQIGFISTSTRIKRDDFFMHGLPDFLSVSYISVFDPKAEHSPIIFFPVLRFKPKRLAPAWYI
jgi:hypothetical protein